MPTVSMISIMIISYYSITVISVQFSCSDNGYCDYILPSMACNKQIYLTEKYKIFYTCKNKKFQKVLSLSQ